MESAEAAMHRLAASVVGPSFVAGAAFQRAGEGMLRKSVPGTVLTLVELALQRRDIRFPKHPYIALTQNDFVVLDFRFTTGDQPPRLFGRWPSKSVRIVEAVPERRFAVVAISTNKTVLVLKGAFGSEAEEGVVTWMRDIARDGTTGGSLDGPR